MVSPALALVMQDEELLAYQTCFDLTENELQSFLLKVGHAVLKRKEYFFPGMGQMSNFLIQARN